MGAPTIFIAGSGGIGRAVGLILSEIGSLEPDLFLGDLHAEAANDAKEWIRNGSTRSPNIFAVQMPREGSSSDLDEALAASDVLLDCLPGSQAPRMARLALQHGLHYANLTEYVAETNEIMDLARDASTGFILQTGLAPGFVGVLAQKLLQEFREVSAEKPDEILMRVGALTRNAAPPHYYGFTWSPVGVATEYVKPAVVIRDFAKTELPSLSERAVRIIRGQAFEEDLTSGGAADLPDTLNGKVRSLDYKTLRYPGHYGWVDSLLAKIPPGADSAKALEKAMLDAVPLHEEDLVVIFASVTGRNDSGQLITREAEYLLYPMDVGNQRLRAIQSTTAAPLAQCAAMLLSGQYKGIVLQSDLDPEAFMTGEFVSAVYDMDGSD